MPRKGKISRGKLSLESKTKKAKPAKPRLAKSRPAKSRPAKSKPVVAHPFRQPQPDTQAYRASRPIAGPDAFKNLKEPNHILSQAATLLLIGTHLRGDPQARVARVHAARGPMVKGVTLEAQESESGHEQDVKALGFPSLHATTARFRATDIQKMLGVRFMAKAVATPTTNETRSAIKSLPKAADRFYKDANPETAAALLEVALRHPDELVRVSAASSYFDVATAPHRVLLILESGLLSQDPLTRDVAAYALANLDPANAKLAELSKAMARPSPLEPSHTSLVVHGTWAAGSDWWQPPNGDFWHYAHNNVDADLYGKEDRFGWSGGYSDAARSLGGADLFQWVQDHKLQGLNLFAHSHGGAVSMLANHAGTNVGRMVLLSCPVHWPKYTPDFTRVARVVSVRVHLDLVILADRGGQRFNDPRIEEHVLGTWFDHFATHKPEVWDKYDIKDMI